MAIRESFLHKIWRCGILWHGTSELAAKVSSAKLYFSVREGFLPQNVLAIQYVLTTLADPQALNPHAQMINWPRNEATYTVIHCQLL